MNIKYDCLPCVTRQLIKLATKVTDDDLIQKEIITQGLKVISTENFNASAPYITGLIYDIAKRESGISDPYLDEKNEFNQIAEVLIRDLALREKIMESSNPIDTALRLSIAGNIIDFSLGIDVDENGVRASIDQSLKAKLHGVTTSDLTDAIAKAEHILFIGDNAGEIVFDKLLIELLPLKKIKYVVKGGPIVNDATLKDAINVHMDDLVSIVDTGVAIQGVELSTCSPDFIKLFNEADLIISKGQANFESLSNEKNKNIFFLLRAKCRTISNEIGCEKGAFVLLNPFNN